MTRDEIMMMEAGREMDALVAANAMGWTKVVHDDWPPSTVIRDYHHRIEWYPPGKNMDDPGLEICMIPHYTSDIAAAWRVVERWGCMFLSYAEQWEPDDSESKRFIILFPGPGVAHKAEADTAPLAICRAALLAVMEAR